MKEEIKKLLREATEEKEEGQYTRIKKLLDDNIFNHSEVIDKLWGAGAKDDAGKRSLFRKKLNQETYNGTTYTFNDDDFSKTLFEEKYDEIMSHQQMREAYLFYNQLNDKNNVFFKIMKNFK